MKTMKTKKFFCLMLLGVLLAGVCRMPASHAAAGTCTTYSGDNIEDQDYSRWSAPVKSYLTAAGDGTKMRVQAGNGISGILVEYYDDAYRLKSTKILPQELPVFGGFYETADRYYLVTGQENPEEQADLEVFRITKYDKNWNRIASAGLSDCNTTVPFDAGSVRMDTCGKYLLIHTSHEMYASSDGYHHQANVTIQVDTDTMNITDSWTGVMNSAFGYVSHSFNQFVKVEGNKMITLDHGDAYPRSLALIQYPTDVSGGTFRSGNCELTEVMGFPGRVGENTTGAAAGGFEISDSSYLIAGHSVVQDEGNLTRKTRNVFVAAVEKTTRNVTVNWLTDYSEGDGTTSTPHMVKLPGGNYMVLWSRENQVYYTQVDPKGQKASAIYHHSGKLSDCVPSVIGGKLIWYTWDNRTVEFYEISLSDLSEVHVETIENGHQYQQVNVQNGCATLQCSVCKETRQVAVVSDFTAFWNTDGGGSYSSRVPSIQDKGGIVYFLISNIASEATGLELNSEMEVVSSDESVLSVQYSAAGLRGTLRAEAAGEAVVTIRPKYHPAAAKTYRFTVNGPLEISSFAADRASSQFGQTTTLTVHAAGGSGSVQYRFYYIDQAGAVKELQGYSAENVCKWNPDFVGTVTLCADVKDGMGNAMTRTLENHAVEKGNALQMEACTQNICQEEAESDRALDLASMLPGNRGNTSYEIETDDEKKILGKTAVTPQGSLVYSVKESAKAGDHAAITVRMVMDHYQTSVLRVTIQVTDQKSVLEKADARVALAENAEIFYGQTLQGIALNTDTALFVDMDGNIIDGVLE